MRTRTEVCREIEQISRRVVELAGRNAWLLEQCARTDAELTVEECRLDSLKSELLAMTCDTHNCVCSGEDAS